MLDPPGAMPMRRTIAQRNACVVAGSTYSAPLPPSGFAYRVAPRHGVPFAHPTVGSAPTTSRWHRGSTRAPHRCDA
jgi:hypothetical protein